MRTCRYKMFRLCIYNEEVSILHFATAASTFTALHPLHLQCNYSGECKSNDSHFSAILFIEPFGFIFMQNKSVERVREILGAEFLFSLITSLHYCISYRRPSNTISWKKSKTANLYPTFFSQYFLSVRLNCITKRIQLLKHIPFRVLLL